MLFVEKFLDNLLGFSSMEAGLFKIYNSNRVNLTISSFSNLFRVLQRSCVCVCACASVCARVHECACAWWEGQLFGFIWAFD